MSSEKEYVDVPNFVLDEVPVLANRARDEITVSRNGLWADPYPHMAKPRRSFSGMTEQEYRKESDPELVKPIPRTPSPQRSASHGTLLMTTAPDSAPSADTSVSSYHTPDNTPQGKMVHGTSLAVPDSGNGVNDGSGHGPKLRHRSSSPQLKATISREGSPLSTTPQHLKYPKSYQSNMELRSQFELEQPPSGGQRQPARPPPQVGQPPVMQPQFPQQQAQFHSPYVQQQQHQSQSSSADPPLLPPRPQRKSHGDNFRSTGDSPSLQQQGFIPNTAIVTWNSSDPAEWTMDRVLYWLQAYRFGPDWVEAFRSRNIYGEKFLSLTSYQNFKKLGIFYNKSEDYDTTPSRFIHLLRKQLNRSASNNSTEGMIAAANSPTTTNTSNNAPTNATAISTPTSASGFQTIAPTTTAPAIITDSQRYAANDSRQGSDVEGTSPESSRSPSNLQSFENLADSHRMAPPRRHPLESAPRPSSHFENRMSWRAPSPSSPSFRGHGFFRRHQKSSSSESGTLALQSASTTSLGVYPELGEPERRQYYGPQEHETKRSRGIFGKLRKKDPRHGREEHRVDSPTSPNASMNHPSSFQPCFADTLPLIYRPVHNNASLPFILVTVNNETFTMIPISDIFTAAQLRDKLSSELSIRDWLYSTVHLTDIGSTYGKALDDSMLEDAIKSVKFQGPNFEILKLYIHTPVQPPAPMSRSPDALSADSDHPATPNYMIYKNDKKPDDYFSSKQTDEQPKVNLQSQPQPQLQPPPPQQPAQPVPTVTIKEASTNPPRPSTSRIPTASSEDSFKVIRPQRREINFDDRRSSPYERRKPSVERKPSNPLVAMRAAPPPPASRQASIKSKLKPPTIVTQLSDSNSTLAPGNSHPNDAKAPLPGPYSPGESEKLIPKPYVSRKNVVTRKPVGSGVDSASPLEPPSSGIPSPTSSPSIRSVNTITASDSSKLKQAAEGLSREPTLKGGQRPEKDDGKFAENEISFEGAPEYVDDDSDDDDGLWAKKPPSLKPERPTLTVKTDNTNNAPSSPLKTPDTTSSCGSPTQREEGNPNWAVRPPAEVVYDNLERFFPNTDLDKPIIDDLTSEYENNAKKPLSPIPHDTKEDDQQQQQQQQLQQASKDSKLSTAAVERKPGPAISRRMKSIRVVAREAREASEAMRRISSTQNRKVNSGALLRRRSTKMWGTKVVEVTSSDAKHISTLRDQKGEFKEFAWVKGELIGKGTFGKVYLALNVTTREMMAVKQVEVPQTASDRADAKQKEVIEALHSEVETLKDLDHLNIVQYLGFEATLEYYNLFLEYVPGGSVGRILQMYGRLEESVIKSLTEQVLEGLSYLHTRGILHRDLKADNLLLDLDGICKISDFGISKKSRDIYANDAEMSMQGTIFWMAPEVIHNVVHNEKQGYSAKVDVWSLGCVVLEMFAGRRPWSTDEAIGAMYKLGTTRQRPPIPEDTVPYVSEAGKDFLDQCFIIDPHKRPTPQRLLQHKFCEIPSDYNFESTRVAQLIKSKSKRRRGTLTNRN